MQLVLHSPPVTLPRNAQTWIRKRVQVPPVDVPEGRWLELPGRGRTWITDAPGPTPDAPAVVLLHAVGCTGLLTWYPSIPELTRTHRVVTFDQRWHGRGIASEEFSLEDCADDVAAVIDTLGLDRPIVGGYSMGGVVAQRTWRRHPQKVGGLLLAATAAHFRVSRQEVLFHQGISMGMGRLRTVASASVARAAGLHTGPGRDEVDVARAARWALTEFNSTSPWAIGQALAAIGRHHATPWLSRIDVPTAVVVTARDHLIPPARQRRMAQRIPAATIHEVDAGHAACVLQADVFVPAVLEAVRTLQARINSSQERCA